MTFTTKEIKQVVKDWMLRELAGHGFRWRGTEVYRKIPEGIQVISYGIVNRLPIDIKIGVSSYLRIEKVEILAAELDERRLTDIPTIWHMLHEIDPSLKQNNWHPQGPNLATMAELIDYLDLLTPAIRNTVVPMFDRVKNVYQVAKEFPVTIENFAKIRHVEHFSQKLAVVYLTGGDWEQLVKEALPILETEPRWKDRQLIWERVERNLRKLPPRPKE